MVIISIPLIMTEDEANGLAQLVKRTERIGPRTLNLVTPPEQPGAESAPVILRDALATAGFAPR